MKLEFQSNQDNRQSSNKNKKYQLYTYSLPPDDGSIYARNMKRLTKYAKNKFCINLVFLYTIIRLRLLWSSGSVLAFSTQVCGFKPGRSRLIFRAKKILSTPSFGGEVKPSVPCCRFAACKRSLNLRVSRNLGKITTGHLAHSSTFRC